MLQLQMNNIYVIESVRQLLMLPRLKLIDPCRKLLRNCSARRGVLIFDGNISSKPIAFMRTNHICAMVRIYFEYDRCLLILKML